MRAYGTFTKIGENIYRTDTYLQFGDSEELIGACVLCNPGSARLADKKEQQKLINYNRSERHVISGELAIDPSMKQLKDILEGIYGANLSGIFRIYNLFTLRNSNMKDAIKCIKNGKVDKIMIKKDFKDFRNMSLENTWVLRAWGVDDAEALYELKSDWIELINQKEVWKLGKIKEGSQYYHPLPRLEKVKKEYVEFIINQYNLLPVSTGVV